MAAENSGAKSPTAKYVLICVVLVVITAIEYFVFKVESIRDNAMIMYPFLGALSLVKLVLVVGSYMHLAGEPKMLKGMFIINSAFCLFILAILFLAAGTLCVPGEAGCPLFRS